MFVIFLFKVSKQADPVSIGGGDCLPIWGVSPIHC